jgi:YD repeat-containing protein
MKEISQKEDIPESELLGLIAGGKVVILKNRLHNIKPVGIGKNLRTKINANIGSSPEHMSLKEEIEKLEAAELAGADTVMDLSIGAILNEVRKNVLKKASIPVGTVPIYQAGFEISRVKRKINDDDKYTYEYDSRGNLGFIDDLVNSVGTRYTYDSANRLSKVTNTLGNITSYGYDVLNNISSLVETVNGSYFAVNYTYNKDNMPKDITYNGTWSKFSYNYIEAGSTATIGRLNSVKATINGTDRFTTTYSYEPGANGSSTSRIASVDNNGAAINYTYDENGNIRTMTTGGGTRTYQYNELNELIREDDPIAGRTTRYYYNIGGNITKKEIYAYTDPANTPSNPLDTINYGYSDSNWKDKLTSYDGVSLSYDAIGNLTNDGTYTYGWVEGTRLASMSKSGQNISFKYNDTGIRTEKTVNGVTTKYHLVGDKVTYETNGTDIIHYTYDPSGKLLSIYLNGTEYYYIRNAQGDIIGLFDNAGTKVVTYTYDAWGKLVSITGSLASTVGEKNPYRYKGYRYDSETGLYYLQSRYYNPEWG